MDQPKSLRDPATLAERTAQIDQPHVAPLKLTDETRFNLCLD